MLDSCSVIIRKSLDHEYSTLGVRAAWAMLSNGGLDVKIILMGDGIYSALGKKGYVKDMFERFMSEDGEVYAIKEDLAERGLDGGVLPGGVNLIEVSAVSELIQDSDSVMTF